MLIQDPVLGARVREFVNTTVSHPIQDFFSLSLSEKLLIDFTCIVDVSRSVEQFLFRHWYSLANYYI